MYRLFANGTLMTALPSSVPELKQWIEYMNNCHISIKFSVESSRSSGNFLDTTVQLDPETGTIWIDLYTKPTDSHNYLHYDLAHANHNKWSLPYSQFLRLHRMHSRMGDFKKHCHILKYHFLRCRYPSHILNLAYTKAKSWSLEEAQKFKDDTQNNDRLVPSPPTNPCDSTICDTVISHWEVLQCGTPTKDLGEKKPFCGPKNLRDILDSAKLRCPIDKPACKSHAARDNACNTKACRYCPLLDHSGRITKCTFVCKGNVTCKSNKPIYCITCKTCKNSMWVRQVAP